MAPLYKSMIDWLIENGCVQICNSYSDNAPRKLFNQLCLLHRGDQSTANANPAWTAISATLGLWRLWNGHWSVVSWTMNAIFFIRTAIHIHQCCEHSSHIFSNADDLPFNPFKPSGVKWLHFRVFSAILV